MANITEAATVAPMELQGKLWRVKVIQEGQGSSAFYEGEVLKRDIGVFTADRKIYMNHPGLDEQENRPARDARDIIGVMKTAGVYDESDKAIYQHAKIYPEWQQWVKDRAEDGVIGLSIRASGDVEESTGKLIRFTKVDSVDLVTEAGAGGKFHTLLESADPNVSEDASREEEMEFPKELAEALDKQAKDVAALVAAVTPLVEALAASKAEAEKKVEEAAKAAKPTYVEIDKAVSEAALPAVSRQAVFSAVESGADLTESVKAEKEKVTAILEAAGSAGTNGHVDNEGGTKLSEADAIKQATSLIWG